MSLLATSINKGALNVKPRLPTLLRPIPSEALIPNIFDEWMALHKWIVNLKPIVLSEEFKPVLKRPIRTDFKSDDEFIHAIVEELKITNSYLPYAEGLPSAIESINNHISLLDDDLGDARTEQEESEWVITE